MSEINLKIIKKIIWLRLAQIIVNSRYKKNDFLVPIHLALGHESIAVAVDEILNEKDALFLTHRNIHYNLARLGSLKEELDEYYLKDTGIASGHLGSMNLSNPKKNVIYSSSILGNNLSVGAGYALGNKIKKNDGVVFIQTGDGGIEEGSFFETLLYLKSNELSSIIIIENNKWSLGTKIEERRSNIDLNKITDSFNISYFYLAENDPFEYIEILKNARIESLKTRSPIVIEVNLNTLGFWYLKNETNPEGKFINYHAGPAPEVPDANKKVYPLLLSSNDDPLFVLQKYLPQNKLVEFSNEMLEKLQKELS
jgi:acetoin:2,6-dichlorophenolindophenol oxidoreductase subunit alpha